MPGVGNTDARFYSSATADANFNPLSPTGDPIETSITTSGPDSLVLGMVVNNGSQNSSGTPSVNPPVDLLSSGHYWSGGGWAGAAFGTKDGGAGGSAITSAFSTNTGGDVRRIRTLSVEFLAVPEPGNAVLVAIGLAGLLGRRRR